MASALEFSAQLLEVVDLAVENDDDAPVSRGHGLVARRAQVLYGEPSVAET